MRTLLLALLSFCVAAPALAAPPVRSVEFLSQSFSVDRKYGSMQGPFGVQDVVLHESLLPELLWIVGYEVEIVGADGKTPMPSEFMCHNNLDMDMQAHGRLFGWQKSTTSRLFTLSQGQFDVRFPDGFGVPVLSTEKLKLTTQVLNHNHEVVDVQVRHKVTVQYARDVELKRSLKPLFSTAAVGLVLLEGEGGYYQVEVPDQETHGPGCLPGQAAEASHITYEDGFGRTFSGHWVVPPGRQVNRTNATQWMRVPFDTTVHYIAVHLHPFAVSLTLRDLTSGDVVFASRARGPEKGIGLEHVDYFSSAEGVALYKDHEYELESVYENTSGVDQDSMASMFLYLLDHEYRRPALQFGVRNDEGGRP